MAGNAQQQGGERPLKPPYQPPPKKMSKNTKIAIICFIFIIVINLAGFWYLQILEEQRWDYNKPTVSIANMTNETVTVNLEVNGEFEKELTIDPDEDVTYYQKYHKGDTIRVYNPTNSSLDETVVLERKNILFYIWDNVIDFDEF